MYSISAYYGVKNLFRNLFTPFLRDNKMPSIKNILYQYGGFLVALVAIALTVVSPRSEELFGISTTKCLLIGTSSITITPLFVCL